jgi:hypothetical protein
MSDQRPVLGTEWGAFVVFLHRSWQETLKQTVPLFLPNLQFTIIIVKFMISAMEDEDTKFLCSFGKHIPVTRRYMA